MSRHFANLQDFLAAMKWLAELRKDPGKRSFLYLEIPEYPQLPEAPKAEEDPEDNE